MCKDISSRLITGHADGGEGRGKKKVKLTISLWERTKRGDGPLHYTQVGMSTVEEEEGGGYHFVTGCYVD